MESSTRPRRKRLEDLTPAEREKVAAIRARHRTPETNAEDRRVQALYTDEPTMDAMVGRGEFPPGVLGSGHIRAECRRAVAALRAAREARGLSLADVAERSGLDRAVISRLENARNLNPKIETLGRYADALGLVLTLAVEEPAPASSD